MFFKYKLKNTTVNVKVVVDAKATEKMQPLSVNNGVINIQAALAAQDKDQFFQALRLFFGGSLLLQEKEIEKLAIEKLADVLGKMTSEQVLEMQRSLSSFSDKIDRGVDSLNFLGFLNLLQKAAKQKIAIMLEVPEQDSKAIDAFNTLLKLSFELAKGISNKLGRVILNKVNKLKKLDMPTMVTGLPIVVQEMDAAVSQIEAEVRLETEAAAHRQRIKILEETPIFKAIDKLMADIKVYYFSTFPCYGDMEKLLKRESTRRIHHALFLCKTNMLEAGKIDFNDSIYQDLIDTSNKHSRALLAPHRKLLGKIVSFLVRLVTFGQVDFETGGKKHVAKPTQDFINKIIAAKQASQSFADSEKKNDEPQDAGRCSPRM